MRGDQRSVLTAAIERGWVATNTRGGHIKLTHPCGAIYFTGRSPSDWRVGVKLDRDLRKLEQECKQPTP